MSINPVPPSGADGDLAVRRVRVRERQLLLLLEEWGPGYHRGTGNGVRYVAEIAKATDEEYRWLTEYAAAHPEVWDAPYRRPDAWRELRAEQGRAADVAAQDAFLRGDYPTCRDRIDDAYTYGALTETEWERLHGHVTTTEANAAHGVRAQGERRCRGHTTPGAIRRSDPQGSGTRRTLTPCHATDLADSIPTAPETFVTSLSLAALGYARAGIPVLPIHTPTADGGCSCPDPDCASPGKHPRVRRGVHAATTDPDVITAWWARWPTANVGLRTGVLIDVCDIDLPDARHQVTTLLDSTCARGPLAATGRGWHLWVAATGAGNHARILDGVDWRGRDGTVVAPPSLHACGVRYRWVRDHHHPLPTCPPRLLALLGRTVAPTPSTFATISAHGPYAAAALTGETQRVLAARPPTAGMPGVRNDTLNRAAFRLGQLVGAGLLDESTVRAYLTEAALTVGLQAAEARRTITSGLTAGQRHPRPHTTSPRVS